MSTIIKIGHASRGADPSDRTNDTQLGDQDSKEVCIVEKYDISARSEPFHVLLRPRTRSLAERSARACEAGCKNEHIGYSQSHRNTLYPKAKNKNFAISAVTENCAVDCASFMAVCAKAGGAKWDYYVDNSSNGPYCGNLERWFTSTDDYTALTGDQYLSKTDYMKRGDVLLAKPHTVMVLENGCAVPPSIDLQISLIINSTTESSINATVKLSNLKVAEILSEAENSEDEEADESTEPTPDELEASFLETLEFYNFSYHIKPIYSDDSDRVSTEVKETLSVRDRETTLNITKLEPDTTYSLWIKAAEKASDDAATDETADDTVCEISSAVTIFSTKPIILPKVSNFRVHYDFTTLPTDKLSCSISFDKQATWSNFAVVTGYRVNVLANGQTVATNDSIITAAAQNIKISLSDLLEHATIFNTFTSDNPFDYNNVIQLSIQPWLIDKYGRKFIGESCISQPFLLKHFRPIVDKFFLKLGNTHKRAMLHNNLEGGRWP